MFSGWTFGSHFDMQFWFVLPMYDIIDLIDFLHLKLGKFL